MDSSYLLFHSSMGIENALIILVDLFEAKIDGAIDTTLCEFVDPNVVIPIDGAIQQGMDMIRNDWGFQQLRDLDGPFIEKWRDVEWTFDNWDAQEVLPEKDWIQEIVDAYYSDETVTSDAY